MGDCFLRRKHQGLCADRRPPQGDGSQWPGEGLLYQGEPLQTRQQCPAGHHYLARCSPLHHGCLWLDHDQFTRICSGQDRLHPGNPLGLSFHSRSHGPAPGSQCHPDHPEGHLPRGHRSGTYHHLYLYRRRWREFTGLYGFDHAREGSRRKTAPCGRSLYFAICFPRSVG